MLESLEGKRGMVRAKPPIPAINGLFGKPTVVNNVLTLATVPDRPCRRRAGVSAARRGAVTRHAGVPTRREHQPAAASSRRRSGSRSANSWTATAAAPGQVGRCVRSRSVARWVPTCRGRIRPADGLRGVRCGRCDGRPRRPRGVRRNRRHGGPGQVCDGVLRRGVVRQVHAVPRRRGARRGGDRPDHRRRAPRRKPGPARRPVRRDDRRIVVRDGWAHADAGTQRDHTFPRRLPCQATISETSTLRISARTEGKP